MDADGRPDLVLTFHNSYPARIFFAPRTSPSSVPFRYLPPVPFPFNADVHGVAAAPRTARPNSTDRLLVVCPGGGRGTNLRPPFVFRVRPDRVLEDVSGDLGFSPAAAGRGRVPVFMNLAKSRRRERRLNGGGPDLLLINLLDNEGRQTHFSYRNVGGNYTLREPEGITRVNEERAIITDVDGDGIMELVHFSVFRIFRLSQAFNLVDVTASVAPASVETLLRTVAAVVELDVNNDGRMDLYLARANSNLVTPRGPPDVPVTDDVLLLNVGGRYVDASREFNLPRDTDSMGVSAEDFDNDGFVDVVITTFDGADILLLNRGGERFERIALREVPKPRSTRGHSVMAFDYDEDGRVDAVFGQGFRKEFKGGYRLMRNEIRFAEGKGRYLFVRVRNEPGRACTSLHAVVSVWAGGKRMVRRVGGRGAGLGGASYIDKVHFGVGDVDKVEKVLVRWTTGWEQVREGVDVDGVVEFGV